MTDQAEGDEGDSPRPTKRVDMTGRWHLTSRDAIVALTVAALTIVTQSVIDDRREDKADRRENLRFLRAQISTGTLSKVPVRHLDLSNQNLSGIELRDAPLHAVILDGADLSHSLIVDTELYDANLAAADISESSLSRSALDRAEMRGANLQGTLFNDVSISRADFTRADMRGAVFTYSHDNEDLFYADFTGADLRSADLGRFRFHGVKFHGADLRETYLNESMRHIICYDFRTRWPKDFQPPESAPSSECRPE